MWRTTLTIIAVSLTLVWTRTLPAQEALTPGSLASQLNWARFEVVSGRLMVLQARQTRSKSQSAGDPMLGGVRESFAINVNTGVPSVHYEFADEQQQLTVDFADGNRVSIHREVRGPSTVLPLHFSQGPKGKLSLIVGENKSRQEYSADSFWHLMLIEPDVCRLHLVPILESLSPNWRLCDQASRIEDELVRLAESGVHVDRERCEELVRQLGSPSFRERQAADRELHQMGQLVVSYLRQVDQSRLDAEQRLRIRKIQETLTVRTADTPERVAAWLIHDKAAWFAMLSSEDASKRLTATQQLSRVFQDSINFDPLAAQAERRAQLKLLRSKLALE
jgi:hypothetical protein